MKIIVVWEVISEDDRSFVRFVARWVGARLKLKKRLRSADCGDADRRRMCVAVSSIVVCSVVRTVIVYAYKHNTTMLIYMWFVSLCLYLSLVSLLGECSGSRREFTTHTLFVFLLCIFTNV